MNVIVSAGVGYVYNYYSNLYTVNQFFSEK